VTPSLYDLLDVDRGASAEEIRAAWKSAIADLDPTDRRFRAYNQAAEVLLDPDRRAAHDAELAADDEATPEPVAPALAEPADEPAPVTTAVTRDDAAAPAPAGGGWVPPAWLLVGLAAVTAVVAGFAAYLATTPSDADVESSTRAAQSAAERAVVPLLSYDYRHLADDQAAAHEYLTSSYQSDYDQLFKLLQDNAPSTRTVVQVDPPLASAIVRSGEDRVQVLLFVNRPTTNKANPEQPVVYKDQVTLTMARDGDRWLVDDLETSPVAR
jgi:Mce-associated membrane protein